MKLKPISEQVVVVMGASSGIGRATALEFARRGARVIVSARSRDGLESLAEEIRREGGEVLPVPADVANSDEVRAVAEQAAARFGRIDTWVHLAAVSMWATVEQTTPDEFRRIVDVNLNGQAYGAMAALPYLRRAGGGALIHVSSVEAKRALPLQAAYTASKHGLVGFLDALRMELEHEDTPISVTNILPSTINTPLFEKAGTKLGVVPRGIPPVYQPDSVVRAIVYAAEHPSREIVVGGAGRMLVMMQHFSARLVDWMLALVGFRGQYTNKPKPVDAPNNLWKPLEGYNRVEGDLGSEAMPGSAYTWLRTHPPARWAVSALALGSMAALAVRAMRNR